MHGGPPDYPPRWGAAAVFGPWPPPRPLSPRPRPRPRGAVFAAAPQRNLLVAARVVGTDLFEQCREVPVERSGPSIGGLIGREGHHQIDGNA